MLGNTKWKIANEMEWIKMEKFYNHHHHHRRRNNQHRQCIKNPHVCDVTMYLLLKGRKRWVYWFLPTYDSGRLSQWNTPWVRSYRQNTDYILQHFLLIFFLLIKEVSSAWHFTYKKLDTINNRIKKKGKINCIKIRG